VKVPKGGTGPLQGGSESQTHSRVAASRAEPCAQLESVQRRAQLQGTQCRLQARGRVASRVGTRARSKTRSFESAPRRALARGPGARRAASRARSVARWHEGPQRGAQPRRRAASRVGTRARSIARSHEGAQRSVARSHEGAQHCAQPRRRAASWPEAHWKTSGARRTTAQKPSVALAARRRARSTRSYVWIQSVPTVPARCCRAALERRRREGSGLRQVASSLEERASSADAQSAGGPEGRQCRTCGAR
jgi:hypothetical protein